MRRYGLFGHPVAHSFSPKFFQTKFQKEGITDAVYDLFDVDSVSEIKTAALENRIAGFNVTIPYKEQIISILDEVDPVAKSIGSVNCVRVDRGKFTGYNTDIIGFEESLFPIVRPTKAIILGSGGASKMAEYSLRKVDCFCTVVSRKGMTIYEGLHPGVVRSSDLIVNTTPLGMYPDLETFPDIPYEALSSKTLVYDLIYNPSETLLLKKAQLAGARVKNGQEMLEIQAEQSWKIWTS